MLMPSLSTGVSGTDKYVKNLPKLKLPDTHSLGKTLHWDLELHYPIGSHLTHGAI